MKIPFNIFVNQSFDSNFSFCLSFFVNDWKAGIIFQNSFVSHQTEICENSEGLTKKSQSLIYLTQIQTNSNSKILQSELN